MATWPSALWEHILYHVLQHLYSSRLEQQRICFDSDKDVERYLVLPLSSKYTWCVLLSLLYFFQLSGSQEHSTVLQRTFLGGIVLICIADHERNLDNTWTFLRINLSWLARLEFKCAHTARTLSLLLVSEARQQLAYAIIIHQGTLQMLSFGQTDDTRNGKKTEIFLWTRNTSKNRTFRSRQMPIRCVRSWNISESSQESALVDTFVQSPQL